MQNIKNRSLCVTIYELTLIYLAITVFVLPSNMKAVASLAFAVIAFFLVCTQGVLKDPERIIPRPLLLLILILVFVFFAIVLLSPWSKATLISSTAFLLLAVLLFSFGFKLPNQGLLIEKPFYVCVSLILIIETIANNGVAGAMYINGAYDKNYLGIIFFLYFAWCWSTSRKVGIVIAASSAAFIGSRNYAIMIVLFLALWFIQERFATGETDFSGNKVKKLLGPLPIFGIFVFMFLAIVLFSFWWSDNMVGTSTTSYGVSMNDSSNAVRFNSNKYAVQYIICNPELLIYGYDNDIINVMGIIQASSLNGTETAFDGTFYNGYRIVQPHNVIVNMLLKEGLLYTLLYFAILSYIFAPYFRRDNAAYWVPYLFGCMFMHSLLAGYYLIFFLLVLVRSDSNLGFTVPGFYIKKVHYNSAAIAVSSSFGRKKSWSQKCR